MAVQWLLLGCRRVELRAADSRELIVELHDTGSDVHGCGRA